MSICGIYLNSILKNPESKEYKEIKEIADEHGWDLNDFWESKFAGDLWFARSYNKILSECAEKFKDDPKKKVVVDALQGLQELKNPREEIEE